MLLSILICTIPQRKEKFNLLLAEIEKQIIENNCINDVEICTRDDDNEIYKGLPLLNVGAKRNLLLEISSNEFICFIDDDDWIAENYIKNILEAIKSNPNIDCIGFMQNYLVDGKTQIGGDKVCISLKYEKWDLNVDGFIAVRTPHHLTPIKRKHCIDAGGYKNLERAEDIEFSNRVKPFLKKEYFINDVMYFYNKTTVNEHGNF
jgi:glycosyltransferase involved in cell wall biosynthesis